MWNVDRCFKETFLLFFNQLLVQRLKEKTFKKISYIIKLNTNSTFYIPI